jgi:hypothetical protein
MVLRNVGILRQNGRLKRWYPTTTLHSATTQENLTWRKKITHVSLNIRNIKCSNNVTDICYCTNVVHFNVFIVPSIFSVLLNKALCLQMNRRKEKGTPIFCTFGKQSRD